MDKFKWWSLNIKATFKASIQQKYSAFLVTLLTSLICMKGHIQVLIGGIPRIYFILLTATEVDWTPKVSAS